VALDAQQIARTMAAGVEQLVADAAFSETVDGNDFHQGAEQIVFAGAQRAYVLGTGSENTDTLTIPQVRAIGGGRPVVVLGNESDTLTLLGEWVERGELDTGLERYTRWTDISGQTQVLAIDPLVVSPETVRATVEPIAYWSFNETSGDALADSQGDPQDLTVFGTTGSDGGGGGGTTLPFGGLFQEPVAGSTPAVAPNLAVDGPSILEAPFGARSAVGFPGNAGAFVATADDPAFEVESGTISFWVNPARLTTQAIIAKDRAGNGAGQLLILLNNGRVQAIFTTATGATHQVIAPAALSVGTWSQVTFSFGAGAGMDLFVNGVNVAHNAFEGGLIGNREPIVIGASNRTNTNDSGNLGAIGTSLPLAGRIDEVSFFGSRLDATQVAQLIEFGPVGVVE